MLSVPVLVAGGLLLLWLAAEAMVRGAATLGRRAGVSPIVIGLTVVSVGTSAPELVVCILAALDGSPDLATGNVLGSNLANVGLILGLAALFRPLRMTSRVVRREIPWMLGITLLVLPLLWNLRLGRVEGAVLALLLLVYLYLLVAAARAERRRPGASPVGAGPGAGEGRRGARSGGRAAYAGPVAMVILGTLGLVAGGQAIVSGARGLAEMMGISEMIVGLSVVAVGTSLPELATTVVAAVKKEGDLAVGNILGSNIFNLTFVLGGTALVQPLVLPPTLLRSEYAAVLVVSAFLLPLAWSRNDLSRTEGVLFLLLYGAAWAWILRTGGTF